MTLLLLGMPVAEQRVQVSRCYVVAVVAVVVVVGMD